MEYIHYGHKNFDIEKFDAIKNYEYFSKPQGGLWASRINAEYGWKDWCKGENFTACEQNNSFKFTLSADANILEIHKSEDLEGLPKLQSKQMPVLASRHLDFEQLVRDGYDGVELFLSDDQRLYWDLYGWDCDSIVIFNPNCIITL